MFDRLALVTSEDYLKPLAAREKKGVYFARFIGYDDDVMVFFRRMQQLAETTGSYVKEPLQNPPGNHVAAFTQAVDLNAFQPVVGYVADAVARFLPALSPAQRACFGDAVVEALGVLARTGSNPNILKNSFAKFMCWAKFRFEGALGQTGMNEVPKILYEGDISKYEVQMLRILSRSGCDVCYLHFSSEDSYRAGDPASAYSEPVYGKRRGVPQRHFSTINLEGLEKARVLREQVEEARELVITNRWMSAGFLDDIFKTGSARGPSTEVYYNLYGRWLGYGGDRDAYLAELYRFRMRLQDSGRNVMLQDAPIANPTLEEVGAIERFPYTRREELIGKLAGKIQHRDQGLCAVLRAALVDILKQNEGESLPKLFNHGMKLLCWLGRFMGRLFDNFKREAPPVFLYYGRCSASEAEFLGLLSLTPVDVLLVCPDKRVSAVIAKGWDRGVELLLEHSSEEIFPFPQSEPRLRATTTAYAAQQELDQILYSDTGLFRHKQFTRCNPVTLKTTYDEIGIYWREEAKYRPNFETGGGRVVVPNIFAKICGVPDGNLDAYFQTIQGFLTPRTILISRIPHITVQTPNPIKAQAHKFFKNGEILPEEIKRNPRYLYDHLSDSLQDFILEKIQLIIEWELIQADTMGVEYAILSTLLNLDRRTLRLIQEFDFTRVVPKVVAVHVEEATMSLEDCILLAFFNLAGFDILVFTPTGYRDVEKYIRREAFEEYQVGQHCFDVRVPYLQIPAEEVPKEPGGLLNRLFGKG